MPQFSNETLAELIQQGDKSYILALWEQCKRLCFLYCNQYFTEKMEICNAAGVTIDDLKQQSYFAMLSAIRYYRKDTGFKFTTFLTYNLQNEFNTMTGLRVRNQTALNTATSMDKPISEDGESITLQDVIMDTTATQAFDQCIERIYQNELHNALQDCLEHIPERSRKVIQCLYYDNMTRTKTAEKTGYKITQVHVAEKSGLQAMRHGWCRRRLKEFAREIVTSKAMYRSSLSIWKQSGMSAPEYAVIKLENCKEKLQI